MRFTDLNILESKHQPVTGLLILAVFMIFILFFGCSNRKEGTLGYVNGEVILVKDFTEFYHSRPRVADWSSKEGKLEPTQVLNALVDKILMEQRAKEIGLDKYNWEVIKYKTYLHLGGVLFTHIPMNPVNKPIGGTRVMDTAIKDHSASVVFGHTHALAYQAGSRFGESSLIQALNVGWYGTEVPDYAKGSGLSKSWWSGVVMLEHTSDGGFSFQTKSIQELEEDYHERHSYL